MAYILVLFSLGTFKTTIQFYGKYRIFRDKHTYFISKRLTTQFIENIEFSGNKRDFISMNGIVTIIHTNVYELTNLNVDTFSI